MLWLASIRGKFDLEGGERERESVCVCVCLVHPERERERECVCVLCIHHVSVCLYACGEGGGGLLPMFASYSVYIIYISKFHASVHVCVCFQIYAITGNLWGLYGAR